jgi:type VI secretion system Hcp family effector
MPTATHAYIRITGQHQGVFKGGTCRPNRGDNWMQILEFALLPASPRDPCYVHSTGKRRHGTVVITKPREADAPLFFKALACKEVLLQVVIEFTNQHGNGAEFIQNTATLTNARVVKIDKKPSARCARGNTAEYEQILFSYQEIFCRKHVAGVKWTDVLSETSSKWHADSWSA